MCYDKYENNGGGFTLELCPRDILGLLLIRNTGTRRPCRLTVFSSVFILSFNYYFLFSFVFDLEHGTRKQNVKKIIYTFKINNFDLKILMRRRVTCSSDGKRNGRELAKRFERWSALTDGFSSPMN